MHDPQAFLALTDRSTGRRALVRADSVTVVRETDGGGTYIDCGATAIVVTQTYGQVEHMLGEVYGT